VERAFLDRYHRLPEPAQRFLLVAAADDTGRLSVVRAAAEQLEAGDDALDAVERAGLLHVDGNALSLYHPLVRSAVYRAATSAARRAAHRALADAVGSDADRRAWHLAAATDRPDEAVVAALDSVAERAAGRGGHEAAAAAWSRAAELTLDGGARARRLFAAAESSWLGGNPSRASALARSADVEATDPLLRTNVLRLRGQIEWNTSSLNAGYEFIVAAARTAAGVDEALARQLAMLAASLSAWGARAPGEVDPAALLPPLPAGASARDRAAAQLLDGFTAVARQDWAAAVEAFRHAYAVIEGEQVEGDHVLQPNLAIATMHVDDDRRGLRLHDEQLTAARRSGALAMAEHALTRGFLFQLATGAWSQAAGAAAEGLSLAASTGHAGLTALPLAELAVIGALRDDDAADRHLADAAAIREAHPVGITDGMIADLIHWARALREARPEIALHHLEQMSLPQMRRLAALDRLGAAVRAGRLDLAGEWLTEIDAFGRGTGAASALAVAAHGRALLADERDAEQHFLHALEAHTDSLRLPDRARTELAYGEYLRRARRRVDARVHLRAALQLFEDLGAARWSARAAQELRASGETARRRDPSTATELTAQERQVAALVRQGLSNRDAAAQLFVSPRTVDFHLRNVFSKLGITSRAELAAIALD
jgi:DNA-binding NarL/FixJ family response regulator